MQPAAATALTNIRISAPKLSPKLRKLAAFILDNPEETTVMSVEELTAKTGISVATIYRFCRELGYKTYSHLKLEIAREIDAESTMVARDEPKASVVANRYSEFRRSLVDTRRMLGQSDIEAVADLVMRARRIMVVGSAVSGVAASFLHYKLLRAGIPTHLPKDMSVASVIVSGLDRRDLLIAFSASGDTREIVELALTAQLAGVSVVAITGNRKNAMVDSAHINLVAVSTETLVSEGIGTSVISQTAVADSIYETLYARNPAVRDRVKTSAEAVISRAL